MKQFTIGYIQHDQYVHNTYLGPSISNLQGEFDVINTSDQNKPASNYNEMISKCNTPYLILTHQDVTFSPTLLDRLEITVRSIPNLGIIGMFGVDTQNNYFWSNYNQIYALDTLDCCFVVIRPDNNLLFDNTTFDDYHLYVEDYCANIQRTHNKSVTSIFIDSNKAPTTIGYYDLNQNPNSFLNHHSYTSEELGPYWGKYAEYKEKLLQKWPGLCVP